MPCAKPGSLVSSVLSRSTTIEVNYICWLVELQIWQIAERVRTLFVNELRSVKILDIRRTLRRDGRAYQDEGWPHKRRKNRHGSFASLWRSDLVFFERQEVREGFEKVRQAIRRVQAGHLSKPVLETCNR